MRSSPRLRSVVEALGADIIYAAWPLGELDAQTGETVIYDATEPLHHVPRGVLLAVGMYPAAPEAVQLVRAAAAADFSAVVFKVKGGHAPSSLIEAAQQEAIALLLCISDVSWSQLDAMLSAAISLPVRGSESYATAEIGDLFTLANIIASNVGGAVTIEDPVGHVMAYSTLAHHVIDETRKLAILGLRTPARAGNSDEYMQIARSSRPVSFRDFGPDHMDRLAIAVRAGQQLLGMLFVLDGDPPLPSDAAEKLVEAAKVTALHLLRARRRSDPERRRRIDAFRALLENDLSVPALGSQLGLSIDERTIVMAIAPTDRYDNDLTSALVVDIVSLHISAWHPGAVCAIGADGVLYTLIPLRPDDDLARLRVRAQEMARAVRAKSGLRVHVGLGTIANKLDEAYESRHLADRVLAAIPKDHPTGVATVDDVLPQIVLRQFSEFMLPHEELILRGVRDIIHHDRTYRSEYARSVLAYLDASGEIAAASDVVGVHQNTMRYRLRRAQELFMLDLRDQDVRLVTWLQLRILVARELKTLPPEDGEIEYQGRS